MAKDCDAALRLARQLDAIYLDVQDASEDAAPLGPHGIDRILAAHAELLLCSAQSSKDGEAAESTMAKLDVVVHYLLKVHHVDYFHATCYTDAGARLHGRRKMYRRQPAQQQDLQQQRPNKEQPTQQQKENQKGGDWVAPWKKGVQRLLRLCTPDAAKQQHKARQSLTAKFAKVKAEIEKEFISKRCRQVSREQSKDDNSDVGPSQDGSKGEWVLMSEERHTKPPHPSSSPKQETPATVTDQKKADDVNELKNGANHGSDEQPPDEAEANASLRGTEASASGVLPKDTDDGNSTTAVPTTTVAKRAEQGLQAEEKGVQGDTAEKGPGIDGARNIVPAVASTSEPATVAQEQTHSAGHSTLPIGWKRFDTLEAAQRYVLLLTEFFCLCVWWFAYAWLARPIQIMVLIFWFRPALAGT